MTSSVEYTYGMNMQICVVTGGAGFIGSHLVDALLARGCKVFALDNLISGREENLEEAKKNSKFTFINVDITTQIPILGPVSWVYHLASPASVVDYQNNAEETALANSVGTRVMLKFTKEYKAKFLFTSTSEIYGDPKEHPQKESYWGNVNPNGLRSCYDESKRFGEMMTMLYHRKHGVDTRIVRIFNTYGPRMRKNDGRVVSNFINQALEQKPITIYGDGKQTRSFCFVSDMVRGLISMMENPKASGEVINLGNPEEYTMIDLATKIQAMTGSTSKIEHGPLPADDPTQRRPDIRKAKELLNWQPMVSVDDGLQKTIEYYKTA